MFALARALRVVPTVVESSSNGTRKKNKHVHTYVTRTHNSTAPRVHEYTHESACAHLLVLTSPPPLLSHFFQRTASRGHPFLRGSSQGASAAARPLHPSLLSAPTQQHNVIPTADHRKHTELGMPCHARRPVYTPAISVRTHSNYRWTGLFFACKIDGTLLGDTVYWFLPSRPAVILPQY